MKKKKKKINLWDLINLAGEIAAASTQEFKTIPFGVFNLVGCFKFSAV